MTDPRRTPERPPTPRWVKVSAIVAVVVVVVIVILALSGEHGPSRHQPGGGNPGGRPPSTVQ